MSSLIDVPAHLALALSLAASMAANEPPRAPVAPISVSAATPAIEPAVGPYRFSEGMWLRALKEDLPDDARGYARSIFRTSGGRYYVPRSADRREILHARNDVALAARVARAFARSNARALRSSLRRVPSAGELFIAHLLGPEAAASLIARVRSHPSEPAAKHAPELVAALHVGAAAKLTLAQLYQRLTQPLDSARAPQPTFADMLQHGPAWAALRPNAIAWQTEISSAPPQ